MSPKTAAKIPGRLGPAQSLIRGMDGRPGRVRGASVLAMGPAGSPIGRRLEGGYPTAGRRDGVSCPDGDGLLLAPPVTVCADEQHHGHLATVLSRPDLPTVFTHTHAPERMLMGEREAGNSDCEIPRLAIGVEEACATLPNTPINVGCGNMGSFGAIKRGIVRPS